jgi:hypothetical protein
MFQDVHGLPRPVRVAAERFAPHAQALRDADLVVEIGAGRSLPWSARRSSPSRRVLTRPEVRAYREQRSLTREAVLNRRVADRLGDGDRSRGPEY